VDSNPASTGPGAAGERHRSAILADSASWSGPRPSLTERAAANRRDLLGHLDALTGVLAAPNGPAEEGIDAGELARIRTAALRLAAAADAALTSEVQP
jgi:hypothetical protein